MGKRVTFETEAERAAYVAGYNDATSNACTVLRCAGVVVGRTDDRIKAALEGVAIGLEESGKVE